jgi:hypothetical protein
MVTRSGLTLLFNPLLLCPTTSGNVFAGGSYNKDERSIPVKRNTLVITAVLFILAIFAWAGWANWEYRKQAAERLLASAAQGELVPDPAGGAPQYLSPLRASPRPAFTLEDLSGKKVSLASYKGKARAHQLLGHLVRSLQDRDPWLIELRNRYAAQGFEVLGISAELRHTAASTQCQRPSSSIAKAQWSQRKWELPRPATSKRTSRKRSRTEALRL